MAPTALLPSRLTTTINNIYVCSILMIMHVRDF